ncbi:MAG: DUF3800 domain-containing protein [Paludibacteraceae bacterium]|nr:DUF3800 domain-containing protein [Paludibacteraceae bacterium]
MGSKTFNIYCDESTHLIADGHPYMLLGYVSVAYNQITMAKKHISEIVTKHEFKGELKWTNVHEATYEMYKELLDYFFMTDIRFRCVIVDKKQIDESRTDYTFNDFYHRMYYQLLNYNVFPEYRYNIYMDIKDALSSKKERKLHEILCNKMNIGNLQLIRSHESVFLQMADVIMGAINYNLRIKSGELKGNVVAKRKLIERIKKHGNIEKTSCLGDTKFNLFFIELK